MLCSNRDAIRFVLARLPVLAMLVLPLLVVSCGQKAEQPTSPVSSLIGHWSLDSTHISGVTVLDQAGSLNGTIRGKVEAFESQDVQGLEFDGETGNILLTDDISSGGLPVKNLTAEAWVLPFRGSEWGGIIGAVQDNGGFEKGWILGYSDDRPSFAISSKGADDGDGCLTYLTSETPLEMGHWYHLVGTYDGSVMKLYVNGKLAAESKEQSGPVLYPEKAFYVIGAYLDDDESFPLDGRLVEIRVYADALTPAEIADHYATRESLTQLPVVLREE